VVHVGSGWLRLVGWLVMVGWLIGWLVEFIPLSISDFFFVKVDFLIWGMIQIAL